MVLSGLLLISSGVISFANNHGDEEFEFYFTQNRPKISTRRRDKEDKSPSYCKVESGKNLRNGVVMKMVGGKYQDVESQRVTFKKPKAVKIHQNTKEFHIDDTRLQGRRIRNTYMTVFGVWSPDSYGY